MDRKKELRRQYQEMKPEMGIVMISCIPSGSKYISATKDIKSFINKNSFQLKMNSHFYKPLHEELKKYGADNLIVEIIDRLDYDKDETKTDYSEELAMLLDDWIAKYEKVQVI